MGNKYTMNMENYFVLNCFGLFNQTRKITRKIKHFFLQNRQRFLNVNNSTGKGIETIFLLHSDNESAN